MIYSVEQIQDIIAPIAEKHRIPAVYLFGSYARGGATENSDVDFLIDTEGTALTSLFALGGLYSEISEAFEKPVDMVTVQALEEETHQRSQLRFRENVKKERVKIYVSA